MLLLAYFTISFTLPLVYALKGATQSWREAHLFTELPLGRMEPVVASLVCVTLQHCCFHIVVA